MIRFRDHFLFLLKSQNTTGGRTLHFDYHLCQNLEGKKNNFCNCIVYSAIQFIFFGYKNVLTMRRVFFNLASGHFKESCKIVQLQSVKIKTMKILKGSFYICCPVGKRERNFPFRKNSNVNYAHSRASTFIFRNAKCPLLYTVTTFSIRHCCTLIRISLLPTSS